MYSYKFSDEETKEIENQTNAVANVIKKFQEIDEKFSFDTSIKKEDYDKTLDLVRKDFEGISQEEKQKQATDSLHEYKESTLKGIENNYESNKEALTQQQTSLDEKTKEAKDSLVQTVDKVKESASNDALKRGLARSSIIVNKLASYDSALIAEQAKIEKDYLETTQKLSTSKSLLEVQRQNALDSFDIAYAVKVSEKINDINEKLATKEREVIEYNNKLEQLEKEYEADMLEKYNKAKNEQAKQVRDTAEFVKNDGYNAIENMKTQAKLETALEFLNGLTKEQALNELQTNSIYKNELKDKYQALLYAINNR